jgi:NACalpha-BTF3-like transcription factor
MAAREKERGEKELLALAAGNDPRSLALRAAVAGRKNGLDGKDVMGLYAPKLERQETNLGDRITGRMVDPITGEAVGDSFTEQVGVDPAVTAKIAYEKGRDNMEYGFKNSELAQRGNQFGQKLAYDKDRDAMDYALKREELEQRGDQFGQKLTYDRDRDAHLDGLKLLELAQRGYQLVPDANGQYVIANPAQGTMKPTGMLGPLAKESADPIAKAIPELLKTYATLASASPDLNPEAAKQAQVVWAILQPFLQRTQGGVGTTQKSSNGGATSNADVEKKIANVMAQTGKSREEIVAALKAKGLL